MSTTQTSELATLAALAEAIGRLDHPVKVDAERWASEHLAGRDQLDADLHCSFADDDWRALADRGVHGMLVATEHGGGGHDLATTLLTLEGLGAGSDDNGLLYALVSQMLSTQIALERSGTPEQRAEWLTPLLAGERFVAFAMTEPGAGSDAYGLTTSAVEQPDGSYVIDGHKSYITFAPTAEMAIVFASTRPGAGRWGITAFLVPTDLDGVERSELRPKMGMRTTPFGDLRFHGVRVPASAVLGRPGSGASIFNTVLEVERAFVFAPAIGAMERQLRRAVGHANDRVQGGVPIGSHQGVSHRIADMKEQHETARLFMYRAAIASVLGQDVAMTAAMSKLVGSEQGIAAAMSSVALHGAQGFVTEYGVERDLRDAVGGIVYSGTSEVQKNIVARLLGVTG
ncbi:MAG: acyl-CoA dehydrogenase family protein [Actinomycetota bacterium]